jgi:hypothetical protein
VELIHHLRRAMPRFFVAGKWNIFGGFGHLGDVAVRSKLSGAHIEVQ